MVVLVKAMKNPRSALCKTSIMASSDIFNAFGDKLLLQSTSSDAFDHLLLQLLLKASQDKRFVCEKVDWALKAMVGSMAPLPLLHKLRAYVSHPNLRVRAKAAISMSHCASKMGTEALEEFGLVSLIQVAVELLNDRLPEAREAARRMVIWIYEAAFARRGKKEEEEEEEENQQEEKEKDEAASSWQSFCQSNLPIHAQSLLKIVSSQQYIFVTTQH